MNRQIVIAICLFLTFALGILLLWPKYQDLKVLQREVEEKRIELQSKEEYLLNLSNISEKLKEHEAALSKIDAALPEDPSLPALFDFLQKACSQSGLVLKGISQAGTNLLGEPSGVRETFISLQIAGSYLSFKNFLSTLEKTSRLIEVESISFSSPGEEGPFTFNLRIKTYSY